MQSKKKEGYFYLGKRITAFVIVLSMSLYGNVGLAAPIQSRAPIDSVQDQSLNRLDLSIPKEIGSIKETFSAKGGSASGGKADEKVVFVIQDAHEIPDAQRNIQKLIDFLQTQYGIRLVALEGAASDLDPQIFKSFPDQTLLKKVFEQYFDQGELAGGTASAIFNTSPAVYHGVEDWGLYEEGLKHFLDAMEIEESVTKRLEGLFDELKKEKEKYYSKELLDIDLALQTFRKNAADLITILEKLAAVRPPEPKSELALLLEEVGRSRENDNSIDTEGRNIAHQIRGFLKQNYSAEAKQDLVEFNQKFQELQTSRIAPEAFALFLKPLAMKYRIKVKVSKRLNYLVGNQKRMKDIQGTKLFDDFEKYTRSVKESLFQSEEERKTDARSRQFELMERLAKLELSREDWNEVKEIFNEIQYWNARKNGGDIAKLLEEMRPHVSFYHNAGKRDHAFIRQVDSLFQKHKTKSAAFIAGGFHAEGVTYTLKSKGISYVLVMPKINRIPDETHYRDHMKGKVSWGDYFEVKAGKVNLFNAFVRGTRDLLLKQSEEERGKLLKEWRDKIIRDLAEKGKLTESSQYTRFIDEISGEKDDALISQWEANIKRFIDGLKRLNTQGQMTEQNILKLFQQGTIPAAPTAPANLAVRSELRVSLFPGSQGFFKKTGLEFPLSFKEDKALPRAEVRTERPAAEGMADILGSTRALWFQDNVDGADRALLEEARKRNQEYLRVTLRDPSDLSRLRKTRRIQDGTPLTEVPESEDGPLFRILRRGGILLIDYAGSIPELVEGFNSLFDPDPYFENVREISKGLHVVGVMPEEQFDRHPVSFYTRYLRVRDHPAPAWQDPIESILSRAPPEVFDGIRVDLNEMRKTRKEVIGGLFRDEKGRIKARKGALLQALEEGKPLLIRGGDWKKSDLAHLIRQALVTGRILFNGEWIEVPEDFARRIYTEKVDYSRPVRDKTIIASDESRSTEPLWVINSDTQDILFEKNHVTADGEYPPSPGLLERGPLHLKITDNLEDSIWHQIMHSEASIEIEVLPGVTIPPVYESYRSQRQRDALRREETKTLEEVREEKSFLIEGEDETYILEKIRRTYPEEEILFYPVTPGTALSQLTASEEIQTKAEKKIFALETKEALEALKAGKTVVLVGLEANPGLARDLETTLQKRPYLVHNGERVELSQLKGRLILVSAPGRGTYETGPRRVKMDPGERETAEMLLALYPDRFTPESYQKILELKKIFGTLPAPPEPGRYPPRPNFEFSRLKLLYQYENRLEAFEDVFIADYADDPEVAAFMRTMVRLVFEIEELGRRPNAIHGAKLLRVLNQTAGSIPWRRNVWQFTETLGMGLLGKAGVRPDFQNPETEKIFELIKKGLVKHHEGEREKYYRARFEIGKDENVQDAPAIDGAAPAVGETWQERKDRIVRILGRSHMAMLKGPPGTGKSFITEELGRELGYKDEEVIGPVTTGSDTDEGDVIGKRRLERGGTKFFTEAAAKWADLKEGGLLIVDEANLTDPDFWNFFMGLTADEPYVWVNGRRKLLTRRHRVIFTGNQETVTGRRFQKLLARYAVTVRFDEFQEAFLKERIHEYLPVEVRDRGALVNLILKLHQWFSRMDPSLGFSLRDVQELSARVSLFAEAGWTEEEVIQAAWRQYAPSLNPEKRLAMEHLLAYRYGLLVSEGVQKKIERARAGYEKSFRENGIVPVASSLRMTADIDDFLAMRKARLEGKLRIPGKRGMVFEGPSGRGKDEVLKRALRDAGLDFYSVTASPENYDYLVEVIRRAQPEGAIVIVSEMNRLPSRLLEGKLNDVLTGKAKKGFALFATINSADFSGRERLSTALQNRILYVRMEDYSQDELLQIASEKASSVSSNDRDLLVNLHVWIRDEAGGAHRQPTTRELNRALEMIEAGRSLEEAIQEVYGPIFLKRILEGKAVPSNEKLLAYREKNRIDNFRMLEEIANFIVPDPLGPVEILLDASLPEDAGGYWRLGDGRSPSSIILRTSGVGEGLDFEKLVHESSHGRFTRPIPGLTPTAGDPLTPLYQDLEDLRHIAALKKHFFPRAGFNRPSQEEREISGLSQALDAKGVIRWLDGKEGKRPLRLLFQTLLTAHAKGLVTKVQLEAMAQIMEGLYEANPFALAAKHADRAKTYQEAVPSTLDEEETWFEQYRALKGLNEIEEDFLRIPKGGLEEELSPEPTETKQAEAIEEAKNRMGRANLAAKLRKGEEPEEIAPFEKPSQGKIKEAKKALEEKRRLIREATKETVERELRLMEEDLRSPGGVTLERLNEIEKQLTNPKHPYSFEGRIAQLKDERVNRSVKNILKGVKQMKDRIQAAQRGEPGRPLLGESRKLDALDGLLQSLGILIGWGRRGSGPNLQPVSLRYPQSLAHTEETRRRPKPVKPPLPKREERSLSATESAERDLRMKAVTEDRKSELDRALSGFFGQKLDPNKIYEAVGILDIERLLETGDPTVSHRRSGGRVEQKRKEIVLAARPGQFHNKPILTEFFHYLLSQGFRVTVYVRDGGFVEGIATVGDLKAVLGAASLEIKSSDIEKDMRRRRPGGNYEIIDELELQRKVEAVYLYGAFRLASVGKELGPEKPSPPAAELSLEEQFTQAKKALKANGIDEDRASVDKERKRIILILAGLSLQDQTLASLVEAVKGLPNLQVLDLSGNQVTDKGLRHLSGLPNLQELDLFSTKVTDEGLKHLSGLPNLQVLNLSRTQVRDEGLKHLSGLSNLQVLDLYGTQVTDEAIRRFIGSHPKGVGLRVYNAQGNLIQWQDVREEYRISPAAELSLEEQFTQAKKALKANGIDEDRASVDEERKRIILFLSGLSLQDQTLASLVKAVKGLPNLQVLDLYGTQVTDEGLKHLSGLPNLQVLDLYGTQVTDGAIRRFIGSHPKGVGLRVRNARNDLIQWQDVPEEERHGQKPLGQDMKTFLKGIVGSLVAPEETIKLVRSRFGSEYKADWFDRTLASVRSEIREKPPAPDPWLYRIGGAVIDALQPGLTLKPARPELRWIYELSISDLDGFADAILETWANRTKETEAPEEDLNIAQAAMDESGRLIDHLRASRESVSVPKGAITVGLRLTVQKNTSFLTQFFKVLQSNSENTEVLAEADTVKNLPRTDAINLAVRSVKPMDWQRGFKALRSDQEDVPVALDIQFINEQMGSMFTGLALKRSEARLGPIVDDFQGLVMAVSLVELAQISTDPQHRSELRRLTTNPKAKADYLKTQLLRRLADLGYPQEMFAVGQNGYLTIEGTIAVAFLEMKAKEATARAA